MEKEDLRSWRRKERF